MRISKEKITIVALGHVEPLKDYDHEEVIAKTAIDLADEFHHEFSKEIDIESLGNLRIVLKGVVRNSIDWQRLNRKVHPDEYADLMKDGAWPHPVGGEL